MQMPTTNILVITLISSLYLCNIHVWEPKNLRDWYKNNNFEYSIADFGSVPYGHSIYGTVFKANPFNACSELSSLNWESNGGTLIILAKRGGCNFSEKVLNAQKIGAGLVLISNEDVVQDVHQIFPIERTKERLDQIRIPSLLINRKDAENIQTALEKTEGKLGLVELAVQFQLKKSGDKSELKFIVSVDDYRGYDSLLITLDNIKPFDDFVDLKIHYKVFKNAVFFDITEECLKIGKDRFCVNNSYGDQYKGTALVRETLRQMCIYHHQFDKYSDYLRQIRNNCFDEKSGLQVVSNFDDCSEQIAKEFLAKVKDIALEACFDPKNGEAKRTMNLNHDNVKYFLINYSPLIFINGYYYKGNFDNGELFFEAVCNSFETPPDKCKDLKIFQSVHQFNTASLFNFILMTLVLCVFVAIVLIIFFYIFYRKKIRKKFHYQLKKKITEALADYYKNEEDPNNSQNKDHEDNHNNSKEEDLPENETNQATVSEDSKPENITSHSKQDSPKKKTEIIKENKNDKQEKKPEKKEKSIEMTSVQTNEGIDQGNLRKSNRLGKLKKIGKSN